ncbi:EamA family transporter [Streptomyces sp. H34-S4]|uniref:EamA family transporter n=1 Tax=Streptomyces sp. H34-S4 TaxID=2996463 RepID=UPI00226FF527|nr:EamA family transporter [Streptomyces sp. H34-S4]MCY0934910.1 EamA family transporter [Streptomyces sp. H34-S4]
MSTSPPTPPHTEPPPRQLRDLAPGIVGMALVGSSVTVSRSLVDAPLFGVQAARYTVAALLLFGLARAARVRITAPRGPEWLWLAGVAATGLVLFNVAVVRGVAHAEPAVIAVAVASVPVLLGVIGPLLEGRGPRPSLSDLAGPAAPGKIRKRRPSRRVLLAAPVVVAGAVLVEGTGRTDAAGIGWAALALGCEAGFTLLAVPVLRRHGAWGVSLHAVWMGAAMFAVLTVCVEEPAELVSVSPRQWAAAGYLAVMVTAVAFLLWYRTVAAVGSGRAGLLTGVAPLAAAGAGAATGGGVPGPAVWLGLAVVIAGLAAGLRPERGPGPPAGGRPSPAPAARKPRNAHETAAP